MSDADAALRVVLGVCELERLAKKDSMRPHLMDAYHMQQSLQRFAQACLDEANHAIYDDLIGGSSQKQLLVTILPDHWELDPTADPSQNLLFVEPSLSDSSYIVKDNCVVPLGDVDEIASFLQQHPDMMEAYMQVCFRPHRVYYYDTPDATILSVEAPP